MIQLARGHEEFVRTNHQLGVGGMSFVYRARQESMRRFVAVKFLKPGCDDDESRLQREAEIIASLEHPYIVPVYGLGRDEKGRLFYAMKELRNRRWAEEIRANDLERNLDILLKVADALAFAHTKGVCHLDLKPGNVFIGDYGEVYLTDWGVSKRSGDDPEDAERGTPQYVSPECARGEFHTMGSHSDVYLLGAVLFEIVTGQPPRDQDRAATDFFAAANNHIRPVETGGELLDIAMKAMDTDPAQRYRSVGEFQAAIRSFESHAESVGLTEKAEQSFRQAEESGAYRDYQAAYFALEDALRLWSGNDYARERIVEVRMAYARRALAKGDLDLAQSEVDVDVERFDDLRRQVDAALEKREKSRRQRRRFARLALIAVVVGLLVAIIQSVEAYRLRVQSAEHATETARATGMPAGTVSVGRDNIATAGRPRSAGSSAGDVFPGRVDEAASSNLSGNDEHLAASQALLEIEDDFPHRWVSPL